MTAGGETGVPRSPRGTRLKATTERAFLVSAGSPPAGSGYRRGLFIIAARADRGSPQSNPRQHGRVFGPLVGASPSRVVRDPKARPISSGLPLPCLWGERHDGAHP